MFKLSKILIGLFLLGLVLVFFYGVQSFLIAYCLGAGFRDYIPYVSDPLLYWKEVYNMRSCLIHTGYFGHEELLSTVNRLGIDGPGASHGLLITFFYSLCSLPVWKFDTPLYVNIVLTAVGVWAYIILSGNDKRTSVMACCALISLYPFYYFNAYNSFQSVHILLACLSAVLVLRILKKPMPASSKRVFFALSVILCLGGLMRKDWALLLIPVILLPAFGRRRRWTALLLAIFCVLVVSMAFDATRSPYPYQEFTEDQRPYVFSGLARGDIHPLLEHCANNLKIFTQFVNKHDFATVYAAFLICMVGLFALALPAGQTMRRLRWFNILSVVLVVAGAMLSYYLFQIMVLKIVFPLFVLLLLVNVRFLPPKVVVAFVLLNLLFFPKFIEYCQTLAPDYHYATQKQRRIEAFARQTAPFLVTSTENRWKNTVLTFEYAQELLALPPCISFMDTRESFLRQRDYVVRTGYVLVKDKNMETLLLRHNKLTLLTHTSAGNLYAVN